VNRDALVVLVDDADAVAALVRIGCAATAASPLASTDGVGLMRRQRLLRIGQAFLDEIDPEDDTPQEKP
jgi:hypothetical protein